MRQQETPTTTGTQYCLPVMTRRATHETAPRKPSGRSSTTEFGSPKKAHQEYSHAKKTINIPITNNFVRQPFITRYLILPYNGLCRAKLYPAGITDRHSINGFYTRFYCIHARP